MDLPTETICYIMDFLDVKNLVKMLLLCKQIYSIVAIYFKIKEEDLSEHMKSFICKFCSDINRSVPIGHCSNCAINCDDCGRKLPKKLTVTRDIRFQENCGVPVYLEVCRFGCRFMCFGCKKIFVDRYIRDNNNIPYCDRCFVDCSRTFEETANKATNKVPKSGSKQSISYGDNHKSEFPGLYCYELVEKSIIKNYDPWWENHYSNKIQDISYDLFREMVDK